MQEDIQFVVSALSMGGYYALLALGLALLFGIMNLINFAHGELIMVGAYVVVLTSGWGWVASLVLAVLTTVIIALLCERLAFRPIRNADPTTMLITSFALSYFLQSLAQLLFGSLPKSTSALSSLSAPLVIGGVTMDRLSLLTVVLAGILLVALGAFLRWTAIGIQLRAAAEDFRIARMLGVRADRVVAVGFVLSGLLAGVASILMIATGGVVGPTSGSGPILVAFIATILGGLGSLRGAVLGGLVLGALTVGLQTYLPIDARYYRDAIAFGLVILLLVARPQGLIVARSTARRV